MRHFPQQNALRSAHGFSAACQRQRNGDFAGRGREELLPGAHRANLASPVTLLAMNIVGQTGTTSYAVPTPLAGGRSSIAWAQTACE